MSSRSLQLQVILIISLEIFTNSFTFQPQLFAYSRYKIKMSDSGVTSGSDILVNLLDMVEDDTDATETYMDYVNYSSGSDSDATVTYPADLDVYAGSDETETFPFDSDMSDTDTDESYALIENSAEGLSGYEGDSES